MRSLAQNGATWPYSTSSASSSHSSPMLTPNSSIGLSPSRTPISYSHESQDLFDDHIFEQLLDLIISILHQSTLTLSQLGTKLQISHPRVFLFFIFCITLSTNAKNCKYLIQVIYVASSDLRPSRATIRS